MSFNSWSHDWFVQMPPYYFFCIKCGQIRTKHEFLHAIAILIQEIEISVESSAEMVDMDSTSKEQMLWSGMRLNIFAGKAKPLPKIPCQLIFKAHTCWLHALNQIACKKDDTSWKLLHFTPNLIFRKPYENESWIRGVSLTRFLTLKCRKFLAGEFRSL